VHEAAELRLALEEALRRLPPGVREAVGLTHIGDAHFARLLADAEALLAFRLAAKEAPR
jgi:hypothetical protein